jgi:hypothetical protein
MKPISVNTSGMNAGDAKVVGKEELKTVNKVLKSTEDVSGFKGRAPCDWNIVESVEKGMITARNDKTGESFEGTRKDFNHRMRG